MADIAAALETLKSNLSTGCLTVTSPRNGIGRIYLLFGAVVQVTSLNTAGGLTLGEVLGWSDATATFNPNGRPTEPLRDETHGAIASADPVEFERRRRRTYRQARWILRSGTFIGLLLFVLMPATAVGLAGWWLWQSRAPEAAAAATYKAAPPCRFAGPGQGCFRIEQGELVSVLRIPGRCGSETDRLTILLPDGQHKTDVTSDCMAPYVAYGDAAGQVSIKLFGGRITAVGTSDGRMLETVDSPAVGASSAKGVSVVTIALLGPWLLFLLYVLVRHPGAIKDGWKLLRNGQLRDPESKAVA